MTDSTTKSSTLLIAAAWAVVILPTAWGLNYTVQNALNIFVKPVAGTSATSSSVR